MRREEVAAMRKLSAREKRLLRNAAKTPPVRTRNPIIDPEAVAIHPAGKLILGVDPGLTGAVALYDTETKNLVEVWDMPLERNDWLMKNEIRARMLAEFLRPYALDVKAAIVEQVTGRQNQGTVHAFQFGSGYGTVRAVIRMLGMSIIQVVPQVWKPQMGVTHNKDTSRAKAEELFPDFKWYFTKRCDDGRAEAALLAKFGEGFLK